jgi:hypothetical protein
MDVPKDAPLIELAFGFEIAKPESKIEPFELPTCIHCGGKLKYFASTSIQRFDPILSGAG